MAVPTFDRLMRPILNVLRDGNSHHLSDLVNPIAAAMGLTDEDQSEQLPSGHLRLPNRIHWAKFHLSKAGAVETTAPGTIRITERGRTLLQNCANDVSTHDLEDFIEYRDFISKSKAKSTKPPTSTDFSVDALTNNFKSESSIETPEETIQLAYQKLKAAVTSELLDTIRLAKPHTLSTVMIGVLIALGYGDAGSGIVVDGVNDGGIDALVKKDPLGLSNIYIQAKRYKAGNNIGSPDIQQFAGSMQERKADEGVFVTTSDFTKAAYASVEKLHSRIVLINGERLAEIMFELGVGVKTVNSVDIKRVDSDYFTDS